MLTYFLLTQTKTPLALASGTPALVTTLFVIGICEELKLCSGLKTLHRFLKLSSAHCHAARNSHKPVARVVLFCLLDY